MAQQKKMVEDITSMEEDFSKWYTDIVKKAELMDYSSVKGCMVIEPYGYATVSYTHLMASVWLPPKTESLILSPHIDDICNSSQLS